MNHKNPTYWDTILQNSFGISFFMRNARQSKFNNTEDNNDIAKEELDQKIIGYMG